MSRPEIDLAIALILVAGELQGYLLGLSEKNLISDALASRVKLKHWSDGYRAHGVNPKEQMHTSKYMSEITSTGEVIVFGAYDFVSPGDWRARSRQSPGRAQWAQSFFARPV